MQNCPHPKGTSVLLRKHIWGTIKFRPEEPGGIASPSSWVRETPAAENSSEFLRFYKNSPACTLLRWIMRGRQIRDVEPSYVCLSPRSCMVSEPFLCFAVLFLEVICPLAGSLSVNPVSSRWLRFSAGGRAWPLSCRASCFSVPGGPGALPTATLLFGRGSTLSARMDRYFCATNESRFIALQSKE